MGEFESKLESILNDPQAMSRIMTLARSLSDPGQAQGDAPPPPSAPVQAEDGGISLDPKLLGSMAALLRQGGDDQRTALLNALRPFVKERRYAKLDKAIQIARLSRMARMALEMFKAKDEPDV